MALKIGAGAIFAGLVTTLLVIFLLTHGGGDLQAQVGDPDRLPSHSTIQEIWNNDCVRCHRSSSPAAALDLTPEQSFHQLVGVPSVQAPDLLRVEPEHPENSYLFLKIAAGRQHLDRGGRGRRMPLGAPPLPPPAIRLIENWIRAGAHP